MSDTNGGDAGHAADHAEHTACEFGHCVSELRAVIRAQPIAAALVVLALGYLCGRLASVIPSRH